MPTVADTQLSEDPFDSTKGQAKIMQDLLSFWVRLSNTQQRAFLSLINEIEEASHLVETSTEALSENFVELAKFTLQQLDDLNRIIQSTPPLETDNALPSTQTSQSGAEKEDMENLVVRLRKQNQELRKEIKNSAAKSNEIANKFSEIIIGIQFQDRTSQRLDHVVDTLRVLSEAGKQLVEKSEGHLKADYDHKMDLRWQQALLGQFDFSPTQELFITNAFNQNLDLVSQGCKENGAPSETQDIELF